MLTAPSPNKAPPQVLTITALQILALKLARRYLLNCTVRASVMRGSPFFRSSCNLEWSCDRDHVYRCVFTRSLALLHELMPTLMFALLFSTLIAVIASLRRGNGAHLHECGGGGRTRKVNILDRSILRDVFWSNFTQLVLIHMCQGSPTSRGRNAARNRRVPILGSFRPSTYVRFVRGSNSFRRFGIQHVLNERESCRLPIEVSSLSFCSYDLVRT